MTASVAHLTAERDALRQPLAACVASMNERNCADEYER
jgi:hypothetical protein